MPVDRRIALSLLAASLLAACGGEADAEPARTDAPHALADAPSGSDEAELEEITDYRLTMDRVQRLYRAQRNLFDAMRADPELAARLRRDDGEDADESSLDEMEARFRAVPEAREALEEAGLDPREFSVILWSLVQASIAQAGIEMGTERDSVLARTGVHPANLDFVRDHEAELERLQAELEALAPQDAEAEEDREE